MKNLLAYTPEPFDNLELENFEYEPVSSEDEMEDEGPRRGKRVPQSARRIAGRGRMPLLSKRVPQIKPSFRPRIPVIPFAPPRIVSAASVNVFPPAGDRRPSGQSSSSGNAGGQGSFANAPAQDPSEHVRWVQETLNRALGLRLIVDGIMNRETRSAVRMFQERKGLPVTGFVGPDTEEVLRAEGSQAAAEPELLEGEWDMEAFVFEAEQFGGAEFGELEQWEGENTQNSQQRVRWIQESLNKILGLRLKVDGIMGPQTKSAIRGFQQKNGLAADGVVGQKTEAALRTALGLTRVTDDCKPPYCGPCRKADVVFAPFKYNTDQPENGWSYATWIDMIARRISDSQNWKGRSICEVSLWGHADTVGNKQYNKKLGQARADAVMHDLYSELRKKNVWNVLINPHSCGEDKPIKDSTGNIDNEASRRVEVFFFTNCPTGRRRS